MDSLDDTTPSRRVATPPPSQERATDHLPRVTTATLADPDEERQAESAPRLSRLTTTIETGVIKARLPFSLANAIYAGHLVVSGMVAFLVAAGATTLGLTLAALLVALLTGEALLWRRAYAGDHPKAWRVAKLVVVYSIAAALVGALGGISGGIIWSALNAPIATPTVTQEAPPVITVLGNLGSVNHSGNAKGLAIAPDGATIALSAPQGVVTLRLDTHQVAQTYLAPVPAKATVATQSIAWSPDGALLAAAYQTTLPAGKPPSYALTVWSSRGLVTFTTALPSEPLHVGWSADGQTIACALRPAGNSTLSYVLRWTGVSHIALTPLFTYIAATSSGDASFAWATDPNLIAVLANPTRVAILANDTGEVTRTLTANAPINALAWSPDGALMAVGQTNGGIALFDLGQSRSLGVVDVPAGTITRLSWAPDNRHLLAVMDERVVVIDTVTRRILNVLNRPAGGAPSDNATAVPVVGAAKPTADVTVLNVVWSPTSQVICALYDDGGLALWSFASTAR